MQIALAQLNPLVGDLAGNGEAILAATQQAGQQAAGESVLVVTPELSLWGYPPRDLLLRPSRTLATFHLTACACWWGWPSPAAVRPSPASTTQQP